MRDFFLLQTILNTGNNWGNLPLYNEENKVLKGLTMKTLVIATIIASVTATASFAQSPNNYIGTDNNGVISERYGNNANIIITRDMATQNELNNTNRTVGFLTNEVRGRDAATNGRVDGLAVEINRVDQEDHRVVNASVNSDGKLVLHSQDMDGGSKRNLTTTAQITGQDGATGATGATGQTGADGKKGTNGTDGKDGEKGANGTDGKDGEKGANGADGKDGEKGANGADGKDGEKGANGADGKDGEKGANGKDGKNGKNAVAPLGSLSFAAASASFSGNGMGFGLSASNYSSVEGSVVVGVDLGNNWRAVAGVTTDFNKRHAASVGVGVSF
jgi:hypothetical protein